MDHLKLVVAAKLAKKSLMDCTNQISSAPEQRAKDSQIQLVYDLDFASDYLRICRILASSFIMSSQKMLTSEFIFSLKFAPLSFSSKLLNVFLAENL
jgi:hypothetical protein